MARRCVVLAVALAVLGLAAGRTAVRAGEDAAGPDRVKALLREAEELEGAGKLERAAALREEAKRLAHGAPAEAKPQASAERAAQMEKRIRALREMAGVAEQEGMGDAAAMFRKRAEALERELRGAGREPEVLKLETSPGFKGPGGTEAEVRALREHAEQLEREGRKDQAAELRARADKLAAQGKEAPRAEGPNVRQLAEQNENLRRQVTELSAQVEELRRQMQQLREELAALRK